LPRWGEMWLWISWPVLAIGLFGIHQIFARRRSGKITVRESAAQA
jgi:hypothetical protein